MSYRGEVIELEDGRAMLRLFRNTCLIITWVLESRHKAESVKKAWEESDGD